MNTLRFTCPNCKHGLIHQVTCGSEDIDSVWMSGDGRVEIGRVSSGSNASTEYSCALCGTVLESHGKPVGDPQQLFAWIAENCPQEKPR
jgi:predicted RNA-binding Zn-ribbon protein involved in translation (DUF1610 family)